MPPNASCHGDNQEQDWNLYSKRREKQRQGWQEKSKRKGNVYMSSYRSKVFAYDVDEGFCQRKKNVVDAWIQSD